MWFQSHKQNPRGIGVLYLGRRGAGRLFTEHIIKLLHDSSQLEIAFVSSSAKFSSANQRTIEIRTPHDYKSFYMLLFFITDVSKAIFRLRRRLPETFILPMASPLDHFIAKILRALGVKIVRIIHDVAPHLGERWPKNNSIRKRILNSDGVAFLTEYVQNECESQFSQRELKLPPTCVIGHPFFPQDSVEKVHLPEGYENYSLIIGRIEKYKGIPEFLGWWKTRTTILGGKLVIAGDGSYSSYLSTLIASSHEDVFFINKWLSDSEFEYLISNAQLVILPYLEATQSGVIPIARYHQVPMLVSNSGGLLEQLTEYSRFEVYDHTVDPSELLHSLLETNSQDSPRDNSKHLELSVFLRELLNFATKLG